LILILSGIPAGLATGLLAWLVAGGPGAGLDKLNPIEDQLMILRAPREPSLSSGSAVSIADLAASPLFALTVGPGAVREPSIAVQGVSMSAGRVAALLVIDGQPPAWVPVGQSREGVTVRAVGPTRITVDTLVGLKEIGLGESPTASAPVATEQPAVGSTNLDRIPSGFRSPPPPASAPRTQ
jgi:hypothetical protein